MEPKPNDVFAETKKTLAFLYWKAQRLNRFGYH